MNFPHKERIVKKISLLVAAGALVVAALATAPPSQGHNATVWKSHPGGGAVAVTNHKFITLCDTDVDGHKVYIRYRSYNVSGTYTPNLYAPSRNCVRGKSIPSNHYITTFVACVQYEGCSSPEVARLR